MIPKNKKILLAIAILFTIRLSWNLYKFPLFPFQMDNNNWTAPWLLTTVGDYYCQYIAFMYLIFQNKGVGIETIILAILNATLGSSVALLYLVFRN